MVWARLDDEILDNPKIARAGVFGFALHVAAITWCCRNLTDGFIPYARCASLLDLSAVNYDEANPCALPDGPGCVTRTSRESNANVRGTSPTESTPEIGFRGAVGLSAHAIATHLADVGLWDRVPGGYQIHDFLMYNPSRKEVLGQREAAKERRNESREKRRKNVTRTSSERPTNVIRSSGRPVPDPDPDLLPSVGDLRARDPELVEVVPGNAVNDEAASPAPVSPATPPPAWFVEVIAAVAMATGEELRVAECWLRYAGHRAGKPEKRAGPDDARYWVTSVLVPDARRERLAAKRAAERPPPGGMRNGPPEPAPAPYHAVWKPPKDQGAPIRGEDAQRLGDGLLAALGGGGARRGGA